MKDHRSSTATNRQPLQTIATIKITYEYNINIQAEARSIY